MGELLRRVRLTWARQWAQPGPAAPDTGSQSGISPAPSSGVFFLHKITRDENVE